MQPNHSNTDLDWLAFCYAAGELDAAAIEAFELRLAGDQAAREALARAVELSQVLAAAEAQIPQPVPQPVALPTRDRFDWTSRLSWMAIGGVAAALLAVLWSGLLSPTWQSAKIGARAAAKQNLASAWNETRTQIATERAAGLWPSAASVGSESFGAENEDDLSVAEVAFDDSLEDAPSWMTAAVFSLSPGPEGDENPAAPF